MNYEIIPSPSFQKQIKHLKKKYRSIINDVDTVIEKLKDSPFIGINLFDSTYKIRVKSSDILKGKSGGYRIIYYVVTKNKEIYLLAIYAKSERENITKEDIKDLTNYVKSLNSI